MMTISPRKRGPGSSSVKSDGTGKAAKASQTVAAIERAVDTLLYFTRDERSDCGVSEIARDLNMSKAAVHRVLASLRSRDLVTVDENTRRYSLGPTVLTLGMTYLDRIDVRKVAALELPRLSEETQETATLSVRTGNSRIYIDQVTPAREVIMSVKLAVPYPLHAGSSSKAFLAFLPEREIETYLAGGLERLTDSTIMDKRVLRRELKSIRTRGWAESQSERQLGASSVAAPVLDHHGLPVAVISVCGPADRFLADKERSIEALLRTTTRLSTALGYVPGDQ